MLIPDLDFYHPGFSDPGSKNEYKRGGEKPFLPYLFLEPPVSQNLSLFYV
jgi:hypothetical protein